MHQQHGKRAGRQSVDGRAVCYFMISEYEEKKAQSFFLWDEQSPAG